jgi:hypothetical protein
MADQLAKRGSEMPYVGPEPSLGVTKSFTKRQVQAWLDERHREHWVRQPGLRQAKLFVTPKGRSEKGLISLSRGDLRILVGLLTGHCALRYTLRLMEKSDTDICRFCDLAVETAEHVLCECEALGRLRFQHLGNDVLQPEDISRMATGNILNFVKEWWWRTLEN